MRATRVRSATAQRLTTKAQGKFGKGALTAYILSDGIQVLSGSHLLILDPHQSHLPKHAGRSDTNSVQCSSTKPVSVKQGLEVKQYRNLALAAPGQLQPFQAFTTACGAVPAFSAGSSYQGTIFRLALRTPSQAAQSEICQDSLSPETFASTTLAKFIQAVPDFLLFTRNVRKITVYIKEAADSQAIMLHQSTASTTAQPGASVMQKYTINSQHADATVSKQVWARHSVTNSKPPRYEGGVAALMHTASADSISKTVLPAVNGRIFVTMPMPFPVTGLPLQVNGSLMVQAARRKLWSGDGDKGRVSALCHFSCNVHHHTSGLGIAACSPLHSLPMTLVSCCAARSSYDQNCH